MDLYPIIEIIPWVLIYSFWLILTICFFLFLWMLKKLSSRFGSDLSFFTRNIWWYFLSVFVFSRLFYIITKWNDLKYIRNPFEFFIMSDFNFSLAWAIFWFLLIFIIHLRVKRLELDKYIDTVVLSFLFIAFIWYIWALLWWQVYWRETFIWIEISYTNSFSPVPYQVPIFPLPIVYSIVFFILFSSLYIMSMFIKIRWFLWYIWMIIFSSLILILEHFSWKIDIIRNLIWINLMQLFSIWLIIFSWYHLYKLAKKENLETNKV